MMLPNQLDPQNGKRSLNINQAIAASLVSAGVSPDDIANQLKVKANTVHKILSGATEKIHHKTFSRLMRLYCAHQIKLDH